MQEAKHLGQREDLLAQHTHSSSNMGGVWLVLFMSQCKHVRIAASVDDVNCTPRHQQAGKQMPRACQVIHLHALSATDTGGTGHEIPRRPQEDRSEMSIAGDTECMQQL
jgi:hypothetical protein